MKIIHLILNDKFSKGVVKYYDHYFPNMQHEILYINYSAVKSLILGDLDIEQNEIYLKPNGIMRYFLLFSYLRNKEFDYLIMHSMFFFSDFGKLLTMLNPYIMNKLVWIEWGADLYSWKNEKECFKNTIKDIIGKNFRNKIKYLVGIFPSDIEWFKKEFKKSKAITYYAPYSTYPPNPEFNSYTRFSRLRFSTENNEPIYIQIGHNGMETLNHIEVLKKLEKFTNENIMLFIPLSYGGSQEYRIKVSEYAEQHFPGKAITLTELMPEDEYFELTKKISIAIFDTKRQCALGNIHLLNLRNVKLYLSENGVMYSYFLNAGVPVQKVESIIETDFSDFIIPVDITDIRKFRAYIGEFWTQTDSVKQWGKLYKDLQYRLDWERITRE